MKTKILSELKGFDPIKLEITIESEDELISLWHRTNLGAACIERLVSDDYGYICSITWVTNLWNVLDKICYERGIDPYRAE